MTILEQIFEVAKQNPDQIAVSESSRDYSYKDLFQAIGAISSQIDEYKGSSRPIMVLGKNDFLTLASMLAVSKTGRAYIPIDAHTPLERVEMIVNASKPSLILTTSPEEEDLKKLLGHTLSISYQGQADFDWEQVDLRKSVSGNDSNYIIYTSGTTGIPKGVEVTHDNLASFTDWMNQDFQKIKQNHFLEQALYSFDLSIFSIYPCLTTGGTLVSLSRDETTNFKRLFERINNSEINTWISTPSFVDICLLDPSFVAEKHPELQQFIFCGEELTVKTAKKLLERFPNAAVYNTYGPTEATGAISQLLLTPELLQGLDRIPLGYAKPGVEVKIMDGELIIVGDSVAKAYFENPEKTKQAFFEITNQKAYHSGDAGSIDADGLLHYQGRLDFQVKFNGFRIELQDIEAHLLRIEAVEKAIVLPKTDPQHKVIGLVAVLKTSQKFENKAEERAYSKSLKAELLKSIMDYMLPTHYVFVNDFPLNANGKIDRKLLAAQVLG